MNLARAIFVGSHQLYGTNETRTYNALMARFPVMKTTLAITIPYTKRYLFKGVSKNEYRYSLHSRITRQNEQLSMQIKVSDIRESLE